MNSAENYIQINRSSWNDKVEPHLSSAFYNQAAFLEGKTSLNSIELALLGDVRGKSVLHLQCHFGQDSLSLARMGAKVTGVDFSDKAIETAKDLTQKLNLDTTFICCDVFDLPNLLNQQFDIVFTSYGTIGWLPDLNRWASVVSRFLKPSGKFVFVEFHPVVWMFDDAFSKVAYSYSNTGAIVETYSGTYADKDAPLVQECVMWNHGLSEVISALLKNDIQLIDFQEYDYSPYPCFQEVEEFEPTKFRVKHLQNRIPMVYSIVGKRAE